MRVLLPSGGLGETEPSTGVAGGPTLSVQPPSDPSTREGTRRNSLENVALSPTRAETNPFRRASQTGVSPGSSIGLQMPMQMSQIRAPTSEHAPGKPLLRIQSEDSFEGVSPYSDPYLDRDDGEYFGTTRSLGTGDIIPEEAEDMVGLTDQRFLAPIAGHQQPTLRGAGEVGGPTTPRQSTEMGRERMSFQSVHFGNSPKSGTSPRQSRLGDDLPPTTPTDGGRGRGRAFSFGQSLSPEAARRASRSPSSVANSSRLIRAGSVMRAMSQRVANIGNDDELPEVPHINLRGRKESNLSHKNEESHPPGFGLPPITVQGVDEESRTGLGMPHRMGENVFSPVEGKRESISEVQEDLEHEILDDHIEGPPAPPPWPENNPLRGKSIWIFGPDNWIRMRLCELLLNPFTEPVILGLIVTQTVLLAIESSTDVYTNPTANTWTGSRIDYAMLVLFILYTLELFAKIIVSGFFFNAEEYSTRADPEQGIGATLMNKYQRYFGPRRQHSVRTGAPRHMEPTPIVGAFSRTFTMGMNQQERKSYNPTTMEEQQRFQLARRAFFRHSLNRIDFVAVAAYWISFVLAITGIEAEKHLYVFRMISCLRILRLLWITQGTAIILKSLKKAAPLLVNVSFLIGFFWLLFAIVGIQAFKSSFSRSCTWIDPVGTNNWTNDFQLCGGHLNEETGKPMPWVFENGTAGAVKAKGYHCPRGSLCIEGTSLYNGTVSFDNIFNSLELVFVIMSANTFTDIMYYTTDSDYLAAALFFAAGIVIMLLWLTNLLIAVITSSFQVIREESKRSAFTGEGELEKVKTEGPPMSPRRTAFKKFYDRTFWIWILIITFGLTTQACRSSKMSPNRERFLFNTEIIVTFFLDFDILLRLVSDFRGFHKRWVNWFDAFLAIVTTVILLPPVRNSGAPYAWLTIFQILRIYRVVWAVPMTRNLIALVLGNASGILNLVLFVFLITLLVALLAVQMFRGDIPPYDDDGETVRTTFFSVWNSFLGMYQILSSENWTGILYDVTSYNTHLNTGWMGAAFLIGWFILAYFILVNMFIAVIQENFDVSEDEKRLEQVKAFLQKKDIGNSSSNLSLSAIFRLGRAKKVKDPLDYGQQSMEMLLKDAVVKDFLDDEQGDGVPVPHMKPSHTFDNAADIAPGIISGWWGKFVTRVWHREPNPFYSSVDYTSAHETRDPRTMAKEAVSATALRKRMQREYLSRHPRYNQALFLFKPNNKIRKFCQKIVGPGRGSERIEGVEPNKIVWYSFSAFIYAAIVTMVILACLTTPVYQKQYWEEHDYAFLSWFVWTDLAFAVLFTVEAVIKIIADGAFWTPNAYFRSLWGSIDGVVLVTLWINVITSFLHDGAISRAVGAFKALRALRLLHISDSARDTFHSVILVGGWRVISAAFVSMSLLVPFAIYGLNLFNGKFAICNDGGSGIINLSDCSGEYMSTPFSNEWAFPAPRVAANPFYDFDNFGSALFILFQIVSQEGWTDVMWSSQSITGRGKQPQDFASQGNAIFFVVFNLMATVFVLTLFISVFMRTYTEQTGVAFLTAEQRSWMELRKLLRQVNPSKRPGSKDKDKPKWKEWCYKKAVQKHGWWSRMITTTLVLHLGLLLAEFYPEPYWWVRTRDSVFLVFTLIYLVHIGVRIAGLSWSRFRRSSWDLYSLLSVVGTLITTFLLVSKYSSVTYWQLHKLFLVSITLLLIPRNNALDQLFKTAAASLTSILNLLATWLILFLVYAIAMTQTFGLTRFGVEGTNNLNFRNVPRALIVLFRMSVGEGWNQIMEDYANIRPPLCVQSNVFFDSDCGSRNWARALFISWNILSMYIFVSLFVSLIYESFSYVYQRSSGHEIVNRDETRRFKQAWATFDPEGTGYISKEEFPRLLGELSGVFAMRIYDEEDSVHRILEDIRKDQPNNHSSLGVDLDMRRHSSIGGIGGVAGSGIDLAKLNARIAKIDGAKVRARRHRYNIFFEEVMVSADPDRGISFTSVLMILAHYNIISDNKSLKLDEFLRRRARLQRVEEEVSRRVVVGFFDTMYWSRRFRRHLNRHTMSRITGLEDFTVPEIVVDDGTYSGRSSWAGSEKGLGAPLGSNYGSTYGASSIAGSAYGQSNAGSRPGSSSGPRRGSNFGLDGAADTEAGAGGGNGMSATLNFRESSDGGRSGGFREMFGLGHDGAFSFGGHSRNSSRDSTSSRRDFAAGGAPPSGREHRQRDSSMSPTTRRDSVRRRLSTTGARLRPHRATSSVNGAEMDLSDVVPPPRLTVEGERGTSRPVSALGEVAMEAFTDSAWGESLRKSFTVRRPESLVPDNRPKVKGKEKENKRGRSSGDGAGPSSGGGSGPPSPGGWEGGATL